MPKPCSQPIRIAPVRGAASRTILPSSAVAGPRPSTSRRRLKRGRLEGDVIRINVPASWL